MTHHLLSFWDIVARCERAFLNKVHDYRLVPFKRDWNNLFFVEFVKQLSEELDGHCQLRIVFCPTSPIPLELHEHYGLNELRAFIEKFHVKISKIFPSMFVTSEICYSGIYVDSDLDSDILDQLLRKRGRRNCFQRIKKELGAKLNGLVKLQNFQNS